MTRDAFTLTRRVNSNTFQTPKMSFSQRLQDPPGSHAALFVCVPAQNKLPAPVKLNLTSSYFIHMLTWEAGPGTPAGVSYNVTSWKNT